MSIEVKQREVKKSVNDILVPPSPDHEQEYTAMLEEWEAYGGRLNPGALKRYSYSQKRTVSYTEWLKWIEDDKKAGQELYFFMCDDKLIGAVSIRAKINGWRIRTDGHCGFGIRPSERKKGYATKMLNMALTILKNRGVDPVVITCAKENIGSAKTIMNNGGVLDEEVTDEETGELLQVYHIG